jgi:hypothetical protein
MLKQSKKTLDQELQKDFSWIAWPWKDAIFFFSGRAKLLTCRSSLTSHNAGIFEIIIIYELNCDNHNPTVSVYCNSFRWHQF